MKLWGKELSKEGFLHKHEHSEAFDRVDRSDFLQGEYEGYADLDEPIPIPCDQTQSAPHMNAIFINYGDPRMSESVLEIGTGSGYLTVILSFLSREVLSVERCPELSEFSSRNISKYGRKNIRLISGNINRMCFKRKFDLIISTASFRDEPLFLRKLIEENGKIIYPLGSYPPQRLIGFNKGKREELGWVSFVNISY